MEKLKLGNKGFSLTELMFAMTILAIGLLALAQMQMMAMRGTTSAREFSTATKIAREGMELFKIPGAFVIRGQTSGSDVQVTALRDLDTANNDDVDLMPDIDRNTDISGLTYDTREVFIEDPDNPMSLTEFYCAEHFEYVDPNEVTCPSNVLDGDWDYVRITNIRDLPVGCYEYQAVMKDVSVTVLWKERGLTRSVNIRTLVGRKDNNFY